MKGNFWWLGGFSITNLTFLSMTKEKIFSTQDVRFWKTLALWSLIIGLVAIVVAQDWLRSWTWLCYPIPNLTKFIDLMKMGISKLSIKWKSSFRLGNLKLKFYVMWSQLKLSIFYWGSLGNLIIKPYTMATPMRSPSNIIQKLLCCIPSLLAKLLVIKFKCELGERKRVSRTLMLLKILRTRQR